MARLREQAEADRFRDLGVLVVEPQTAIVSLLDHFVRSPGGTSLLLGLDDKHDMVDVEIGNPSLQGTSLRTLRLPLDVLILSIMREGQALEPRGFTKFQLGDKVTMVGPKDKIDEVSLRLEA